MAEQTYNFMNEQVKVGDSGQAVSVAPITSSTQSSGGVLSNVQTGTATKYIPPNVSSPIPSSTLTSPSLNLPSGGTIDNGSSAVAAALGSTGQTNPSSTPNLDAASTGDYTLDPAYQTAQKAYDQSVADYKTATNSVPSQYDLLTNEQQTTGATANMAEVKNLTTQLAAATAEYNNQFAQTETKGIQSGVPALFWQGEVAAQQRQASIVTTGIAARLQAAQGNYEMAEQLAEKTATLKFADAQREVDNKLSFIQLNQDNLSRAEKVAVSKMQVQAQKLQDQIDTQKENVKLALTSGVKTKFVNKNGEFFSSADGTAFSKPEDFFKAAGVKSFAEAYQKGLVTDLNGETLANMDLVRQAQAKYPDVAIPLNATPTQVAAAIKGSRIYQEQVRPPVGTGSGTTTIAGMNLVDPNIDADVKNIIANQAKLAVASKGFVGPGAPGYGTAYEAVKAKYGEVIANKYDKVYQNVFNKGASVDAAFNDAKLSGSSNAYDTSLNVILGSDKFTKDQKAAITNAVQNGQDPFSVIKNQAKNIMGQTNATRLDNFEIAKSQLSDMQSALAQYYAAGGKTNIFSGNYEKTLNKLGEVNDSKLVSLATQIQASLQQYRNAVSGTAYSVQEGADIASIFPGINKTEGLNNAIISGRMNAFDSSIDAAYTNVLGDSYKAIKSSQSDSGEITVKVKATGQLGTIPANEFDPNIYEKQ